MNEPMEVTQTKAEGLSRTFAVKVPASELQAKLDARIEEIRPTMNLKGFRPGKVPAAHVRKMFGRDLMGEIIDKTVNETNQKAIEDAELRPAGQPDVHLEGDIEDVVKGEADLAYACRHHAGVRAGGREDAESHPPGRRSG
jgi:trigger factor